MQHARVSLINPPLIVLKVSIEGKQLYRGANGRSETQAYFGINKFGNRPLMGKITRTKTRERGDSDTPTHTKKKRSIGKRETKNKNGQQDKLKD